MATAMLKDSFSSLTPPESSDAWESWMREYRWRLGALTVFNFTVGAALEEQTAEALDAVSGAELARLKRVTDQAATLPLLAAALQQQRGNVLDGHAAGFAAGLEVILSGMRRLRDA